MCVRVCVEGGNSVELIPLQLITVELTCAGANCIVNLTELHLLNNGHGNSFSLLAD